MLGKCHQDANGMLINKQYIVFETECILSMLVLAN